MRDDIREELREELRDFEARHDYAEMFLDSSIALQIKALRLQRGWSQEELADHSEMHQSQISAMEQVTFSSWTLKTLKQLARAFDLRLRLTFETFGTLVDEYADQSRQGWERPSFESDPAFSGKPAAPAAGGSNVLPFRTDQAVAAEEEPMPRRRGPRMADGGVQVDLSQTATGHG